MPNWVNNTIVISGSESDVEALKKQLGATIQVPAVEYVQDSDGKLVLDENKDIVKRPIQSTTEEPVFAFWNIVRPSKDEFESYQDQGWYHWNIAHWGTKWDSAGDVEVIDDSPGQWHISFSTAWSPPSEALIELSKQFPEVQVHNEWLEEQGFGAEEVYSDGSVTTVREWNIPETHEDYEEIFGEGSCYCHHTDDEKDYSFRDCPRTGDDTQRAVAELEKISEVV